ncbi:MAG: type II/IV secretion system ATPase subunit [Thermofilaceae archaeon]|nr:type II/IV secretion system ATPase subunit [Thermofilaceae archaeon]
MSHGFALQTTRKKETPERKEKAGGKRKSEKKADRGEPLGKKLEEGIVFLPIKETYKPVEEYWVVEPFAKVNIVEIPELGGQRAYYVEEETLKDDERRAVDKLIDILSIELEPPASFDVDLKQHILNEARRLAEKYRSAVRAPRDSWEKILYYVERDLIGYGPIEVMMRDYKLEDISCDGVDKPIHVWHRDYESIPTNVVFKDRDALREFIVKLAHMSGRHISAAFPIVDAMLPGRHRLAATYGEEVSPKGSTFTIRKFRERPFSIIELIESGNIDSWTAAYLWMVIENKMTVMVIGATAAGKTTFLNAITNFFKPGFKVVTIEETPELNLPHENWVQLTSRESYGLGAAKVGEITLYDLVRLSLRYRPDYIIVGEVRGAEAFVLFQAMATGHGGMSTMHADSLWAAIRRLTSPPMNVAPAYIPALNVATYVERTLLPNGKVGRRLRNLWEVEDHEKYREIVRWDPVSDKHAIVGSSVHLATIASRTGKSVEEIMEEIERRRTVLEWLRLKGVRDTSEVFIWINRYYVNPRDVYETARKEMQTLRLKLVPPTVIPLPREEVVLQMPAVARASRQNPEIISRLRSLPLTVRARRGELPPVSKEAFSVLKAVAELGGQADREMVHKRLNLPHSVLSKALSELVRRGFAEASLLYSDSGQKLFYKLTPEGRRLLETL